MSSSEPPKKNPQTKETTDSEISDTPGKRSRSQSRRARRRKAQQKSQEQKQQMPPLNEDGEEAEEESASPESGGGAMQPLQHTNQGKVGKKSEGPSDEMMKQDGLKLRLELNLDIELELKASIRGDITLALLN